MARNLFLLLLLAVSGHASDTRYPEMLPYGSEALEFRFCPEFAATTVIRFAKTVDDRVLTAVYLIPEESAIDTPIKEAMLISVPKVSPTDYKRLSDMFTSPATYDAAESYEYGFQYVFRKQAGALYIQYQFSSSKGSALTALRNEFLRLAGLGWPLPIREVKPLPLPSDGATPKASPKTKSH